MVKIVESNQRRWYLVAETEHEIRDYLRSKKIRPRGSGFGQFHIPVPLCLALYCLTGDELLAARNWRLPRVTFGDLVAMLFITRRPKYGGAR